MTKTEDIEELKTRLRITPQKILEGIAGTPCVYTGVKAYTGCINCSGFNPDCTARRIIPLYGEKSHCDAH